MSIILRFVDINGDTKKVEICEHFFGFIPVDKKCNKNANAILAESRTNKIPIQDTRGQGYDNGSNMKGARKKMLDFRTMSCSHTQFSYKLCS